MTTDWSNIKLDLIIADYFSQTILFARPGLAAISLCLYYNGLHYVNIALV